MYQRVGTKQYRCHAPACGVVFTRVVRKGTHWRYCSRKCKDRVRYLKDIATTDGREKIRASRAAAKRTPKGKAWLRTEKGRLMSWRQSIAQRFGIRFRDLPPDGQHMLLLRRNFHQKFPLSRGF